MQYNIIKNIKREMERGAINEVRVLRASTGRRANRPTGPTNSNARHAPPTPPTKEATIVNAVNTDTMSVSMFCSYSSNRALITGCRMWSNSGKGWRLSEASAIE